MLFSQSTPWGIDELTERWVKGTGGNMGGLKAATLEGLHPEWIWLPHGCVGGAPPLLSPPYPLTPGQVEFGQNCIQPIGRGDWIQKRGPHDLLGLLLLRGEVETSPVMTFGK